MLNEEIMKKLKDAGLVAEDLSAISDEYSKKLDEQVALKVEEEKIKLVSESKTKLDEAIATETTKLEESFQAKLDEVEKDMLEGLDRFLESQIEDKIDESLIEVAGINEADKEIIAGIRELFETKYVALDVEGKGLLKKNELALESRSQELSESIAKNMELSEELDKVKKEKFISESTVNLTEAQKTRVVTLFEGKDFKYTSEKLASFVQLMTEEKKKEDSKEILKEGKDFVSKDDKIVLEEKVVEKKAPVKNSNLIAGGSFL